MPHLRPVSVQIPAGKTYVNNALGSAPVTLNISVKTSSGNVILELAECQ
jgi:hypothetical protein